MRYSCSLREATYDEIRSHLFDTKTDEQAAYLYCNVAVSENAVCLLVYDWEPVSDEHILDASSTHLLIDGISYRRAMKRVDNRKQRLIFLHSHPDGEPEHSQRDDVEEKSLFRTVYIRVHNNGPHGSIVMTRAGTIYGRVWLQDGTVLPMSMIRICGKRFRFVAPNIAALSRPDFFDRQIRAFGKEIQKVLSLLHVGIVGVGGTGSCVAEQLVRLGIGSITVADGDRFDASNVSRVYGSSSCDGTRSKASIAEDNARRIDVGTEVTALGRSIVHEEVLRAFVNCDLIFCCVDKELPRSLLNAFSLYYLVPVIDMGVEIDSEKERIRSVTGRVTILYPGNACLFCRGAITEDVIQSEAVEFANPTEAKRLRRLGYARELQQPDPSVIAFTTAVAAQSVAELLHRITAYAGSGRESTEVRLYFSNTRIRTTARRPHPECYCSDRTLWGRGDREPFLDSTWVN